MLEREVKPVLEVCRHHWLVVFGVICIHISVCNFRSCNLWRFRLVFCIDQHHCRLSPLILSSNEDCSVLSSQHLLKNKQTSAWIISVMSNICVCRYLTASATLEDIGRSDAWVWILFFVCLLKHLQLGLVEYMRIQLFIYFIFRCNCSAVIFLDAFVNQNGKFKCNVKAAHINATAFWFL